MSRIIKRNGNSEEFDMSKILNAVEKAYQSTGHAIPADIVAQLIASKNKFICDGSVEKIQDRIESILFEYGDQEAYDAFTKYRESHALQREIRTKDIFESIINVESNDVTKDNANMNSESPAGMMMKFASTVTKEFVDRYLISKPVKKWMDDNKLYVHDKDYYPTMGLNCLQAPLDRILTNGFRAGHGEARPAKRIETAAVQAAIVLESTQNEMFGGQAIPAFDFYMAPFVRMTYREEIDNLKKNMSIFKELNLVSPCEEFWEKMKDIKIKDYLICEIDELPIEDFSKGKIRGEEMSQILVTNMIQIAINKTVKRVYQAMESFIHNMNSIHSRGGNQVVFSSINYGTDTSAEGRCIMRELLLSTERGVGNNSTAIFPIQIWKMKSGVSIDPSDPNYDLYQLACRVSGKRFFPNFLNLDSSFNTDDAWRADDPKRYLHEVATMG